MKIALVSCGSKKRNRKCKAKDMYTGSLFKKSFEYAEKNFDAVYILSALHGVLEPNKIIEPYDKSMNNMKETEQKQWSQGVISQINEYFNLNDMLIFLAGKHYYEHIIVNLKHKYKILLENKPIGKRLEWLNNNLKKQIILEQYK